MGWELLCGGSGKCDAGVVIIADGPLSTRLPPDGGIEFAVFLLANALVITGSSRSRSLVMNEELSSD